jgi:hypothetical protein
VRGVSEGCGMRCQLRCRVLPCRCAKTSSVTDPNDGRPAGCCAGGGERVQPGCGAAGNVRARHVAAPARAVPRRCRRGGARTAAGGRAEPSPRKGRVVTGHGVRACVASAAPRVGRLKATSCVLGLCCERGVFRTRHAGEACPPGPILAWLCSPRWSAAFDHSPRKCATQAL